MRVADDFKVSILAEIDQAEITKNGQNDGKNERNDQFYIKTRQNLHILSFQLMAETCPLV